MIGEKISHYSILDQIGEGGMGVVYLAMDESLHRRVALKFLPDSLTRNPTRRDRFLREARAAAAIEHPNIAAVHEVDEVDGRAFIVMEYVQGRSLRELIHADGLPLSECLDVVVPLAEALAKAHERGVIHRDIKPDNILITEDGYPKLVDFGLAKLRPTVTPEEATEFRTSEGVVMGTASYMSPEQAKGTDVDARSDIFSLGVVLYEMLSGRSPFARASVAETVSAVLMVDPAPVGLSGVDAVIETCLAKNPNERFSTMGELRLRLLELREPAAGAERSARWLPAALVGLVLLILAASLLWNRDARAPGLGLSGRPAVAVLYFENNSGDEEIRWLSKGLPSMLLTDLAQTPGLDVVSSQRLSEILDQVGAENLDSLDRSISAEVARRSGAGALVVGSIFKAGDEIRIDVQVEDVASGTVLAAESVRGTEVFPLVDQLTGRIRTSLRIPEHETMRPLTDISTHSVEAYRLWVAGREAAANVREPDARRLYEEAVRRDPDFVMAHFDLSVLLSRIGFGSLAMEHREKVVTGLDRLSERDRLHVEARYARDDGDFTRSIDLLEQLVARYPDETIGFIELGRIYQTQGNDELNLSVLERGVDANPAAGDLRNNLGYALARLDRSEEALEAFREYQRLEPGEANPYDSQAEVFLLMSQPEQAVEQINQALKIDPSFNSARFVRIYANAMLGYYDDVFEELDFFLEQNVRDGFRLEWQGYLRACFLMRVGRFAEAGRAIERSTEIAQAADNSLAVVNLSLLNAMFALERDEHTSAVQTAEWAIAAAQESLNPDQSRNLTIVGHLVAGLGEARRGSLDAAREHFVSLSRMRDPESISHRFWYHALEGDIALAAGDAVTAKRSFLAGEPKIRMFFDRRDWSYTIYSNNMPVRDGVARAEAALGNHAEAAAAYRVLLAPGQSPLWKSWLEPRHVLALARLLDEMGERDQALEQYQRFLDLWSDADEDLEELAEARTYIER